MNNCCSLTFNEASKTDPTKTSLLRAAFIREMERRIKRLSKEMQEKLVDENFLEAIRERNRDIFTHSPEKLILFMKWLEERQKEILFQPPLRGFIGVHPNEFWGDQYIQAAYKKGMERGRKELKKSGISYIDTSSASIGAAFSTQMHMERVRLLYTRAFTGLKGITEAMNLEISRIIADGMSIGTKVETIARNITMGVEKIGIVRAKTLVRTEMIRAHHMATIAEYETARVLGVEVMAEWLTAGDARVCPRCFALEGKVFTIEQAKGMIPAHPNCLLDGQVKIYTSQGWRMIKEIKIGDLVLTHKGRFRKVTEIHHTKKQTPDAVKIIVENFQINRYQKSKKNQKDKLSLTDNHPVLVNDTWKEAKDIEIGDKIYYLADECKRCGSLTPYFADYCSRRCVSLDITDRQWNNPKHKKNMSEKASIQLKREYKLGIRNKDKITKNANKKCRELVLAGMHVFQRPDVVKKMIKATHTPEICKRSSERMRKNNPMTDPKTRRKATLSLIEFYRNNPEKRLNRRLAKGRWLGQKTWIEQRMSLLLDKVGINYIFQYPILRYTVDFAIPALKIAIECDGEYWHKDKKKDRKRQKEIEREGWFVLRFTGKKINFCLDEVRDEVLRVIGNHCGKYHFIERKVVNVEKWKVLYPRTVYNLTVNEDESYIANGFIVHNCRCVMIPANVGENK